MSRIYIVRAPLPGLFYRRPDPAAEPFVVEGQRVKTGDTIGLIEVMKTYYELRSDTNGILREFLVSDETPVRAGQEIAYIEVDTEAA